MQYVLEFKLRMACSTGYKLQYIAIDRASI